MAGGMVVKMFPRAFPPVLLDEVLVEGPEDAPELVCLIHGWPDDLHLWDDLACCPTPACRARPSPANVWHRPAAPSASRSLSFVAGAPRSVTCWRPGSTAACG